jgi:hypothetical protein
MAAFSGEVPDFKPIKLPPSPLKSTNKFDNGHWDFPEQMGNHMGFIYVIFDTVLVRAYLGKKLFQGTGALNKGKESNWRKYTSSSKLLNDLLKVRPKEEFEFICIEQYLTKGTLSYSETWSLCYVEAPTRKEFYNNLIDKVSWSVKEPITNRHKERLQLVLDRVNNARVY